MQWAPIASTSQRSKQFHNRLNLHLNPNIGTTRFEYQRVLAVGEELKRLESPLNQDFWFGPGRVEEWRFTRRVWVSISPRFL